MKEEEVEEEEDRVKIAKEEGRANIAKANTAANFQVTFTIIPAFYYR